MSVLESFFAVETAVIVSAGPSLADFDSESLQETFNGVLTIAVKQASNVVGSEADFICYNPFNSRRLRRYSSDTIRVLCKPVGNATPQFNLSDLDFNYEVPTSPSRALASTLDFDRYLFSKRLARPWGPGIMHELVLYLALHLGVSRLIVVGWDIADIDGNNSHFDDASSPAPYRARTVDSVEDFWSAEQDIYPPVLTSFRYGRRLLKNLTAHIRAQPYNGSGMVEGEAELVSRSIPHVAEWLSENGCELHIVTGSKWISDDVAIRAAPGDDALERIRHLLGL